MRAGVVAHLQPHVVEAVEEWKIAEVVAAGLELERSVQGAVDIDVDAGRPIELESAATCRPQVPIGLDGLIKPFDPDAEHVLGACVGAERLRSHIADRVTDGAVDIVMEDGGALPERPLAFTVAGEEREVPAVDSADVDEPAGRHRQCVTAKCAVIAMVEVIGQQERDACREILRTR